ncbi:hypothetical protein K458DRAFT_9444 [Lentithecium fluviatile CBS 122367]|uniref:Uncharacterized protein n=1 Tax=Lentithecium fluviatile CBS 122367 TaxID=1168545 RepID=A0A6G1JPG6_9PLEO|nr:hypothetical protein K458DRAFT_9444 [Lentithecium fluviatile CBS 122367]
MPPQTGRCLRIRKFPELRQLATAVASIRDRVQLNASCPTVDTACKSYHQGSLLCNSRHLAIGLSSQNILAHRSVPQPHGQLRNIRRTLTRLEMIGNAKKFGRRRKRAAQVFTASSAIRKRLLYQYWLPSQGKLGFAVLARFMSLTVLTGAQKDAVDTVRMRGCTVSTLRMIKASRGGMSSRRPEPGRYFVRPATSEPESSS